MPLQSDNAASQGEAAWQRVRILPLAKADLWSTPGWKRMFDILISSALILVLSPLCLLVVASLWRACPGRGFCSTACVGRGGRPFRCYAFRKQLGQDGEGDAGGGRWARAVVWTLRASGAWRWPRLLNVWRGEMSLIGPRLVPVGEAGPQRRSWYDRRLEVVPGLIRPRRFGVPRLEPACAAMRREVRYVDNQSACGDLMIVAAWLATEAVRLVWPRLFGRGRH